MEAEWPGAQRLDSQGDGATCVGAVVGAAGTDSTARCGRKDQPPSAGRSFRKMVSCIV